MNDNKFPYWLDFAKSISLHSDYRVRVGAVIVKSGKPIAVGFNKIYSHPKWCEKKKDTIHAEIAALRTIAYYAANTTIYVARLHKDGTPAMARPCANCMEMLHQFGVNKIVYTINEFPFFATERI